MKITECGFLSTILWSINHRHKKSNHIITKHCAFHSGKERYCGSTINRVIVRQALMGIKLKPSSNKNFNNLFLHFSREEKNWRSRLFLTRPFIGFFMILGILLNSLRGGLK